jgi:hypothetical protein
MSTRDTERLRDEVQADIAADAATEPEPTPEQLARLRSLLAPNIDRPDMPKPPPSH